MKYAQLRPGTDFRPLRAALYFTQRVITALWPRRAVVRALSVMIRGLQGRGPSDKALAPRQQQLAERLRADGCVDLGVVLDAQQCRDIHNFLRDKPLSDRDRPGVTFRYDTAPSDARVADFEMADLVRCPHILALANNPLLLGMAERYIGCKPTISNLGMRWSFACDPGQSVLQKFHRDSEDWRYFKVLVYLTDVDERAGPHVYVRGTHTTRAPVRLRYLSDEEVLVNYGAERIVTATGPAGSAIAVDTAGVHKGTRPTGTSRLMLQIQYSLLPCFAYDYEPVVSEVGMALDRYVNRLIVSRMGSRIARTWD